ncbi:MAG: outer membrane protein assembly factor BamD, partial [Deltaproteobacteria bacterium]|nr:outer membrane protein assembly factor BamD [Deltaproteobacteria bacterium]
MTRLFIASAIILALLTGCSAGKLPEEKTAKELATEGLKEYEDGNYLVAMH